MILYFLLEEWSTPKVSGDVPSPRNRATLTMIDDHHAVLFGGRQDQQRSSGTFILDLAKMVQFTLWHIWDTRFSLL